jgi:CBS-domain-containing membrane protein
MKVRDLMTRDVVAVRTGTSIHEVAKLMHQHAISGLPVLDEAGGLAGIVTESDLIQRKARFEVPVFVQIFDATIPLELPSHLRDRMRHILATRAEDVMSRDVHTIHPDAEVEDLVQLMTREHANPVPVLEEGRLVGVVSRSDIVHMMAAEVGED